MQNLKVHYHMHITCHKSQFWARSIQSTPSHPIYLRFLLVLFFHICLGLPCGLFHSWFSHHNPVCTSPLPYMCYIPYLSHRLGRNIIYLRTVFSRD